MATPSILSTTLQLLRDKLVDNSYLAHPLIRAIEEHGNLIKVSGGSRVEQPVIFGDHSTITELSNGFEPVSMAVTDPFNFAKYEYANFTQPIVLSAVEKAANKGDLAVVSILESKMRNVMLSLKKEVSRAIIKGDSPVLTQMQTLNGMGTATVAANTTGWFEAGAFSTQTNTVGGLSKATFAASNWQNQVFNSAATLALSHLDQLFIDCQTRNPAGDFPDILLMSPACYAAFMALQQSSVRYTSSSNRDSLTPTLTGSSTSAICFPCLGLRPRPAWSSTVCSFAPGISPRMASFSTRRRKKMATSTLIQFLEAGEAGDTSNRRQTETFLANGAITKGDWVQVDTTKTGADRTLFVVEAGGNATGNGLVVGVATQTVIAGDRVKVVVQGYVEGASVANAVAGALLRAASRWRLLPVTCAT